MKKISEHAIQIRRDSGVYFILEKYNTEIRESITKTAAVIDAESARMKISASEYAEILARIYKK